MAAVQDITLNLVTRDAHYSQTPGYGYFLAHALEKLNQVSIPQGSNHLRAEEMLSAAASIMADRSGEALLASLPPSDLYRPARDLYTRLLASDLSFNMRVYNEMIFATAQRDSFGKFEQPEKPLYTYIHHGRPNTGSRAYWQILTSIYSPGHNPDSYLDYVENLGSAASLVRPDVPTYRINLSYTPPPGATPSAPLPLMRINTLHGGPGHAEDRPWMGGISHPETNPDFRTALFAHMDRQLDILFADPLPTGEHPPLPPEKIDAMATICWLVAQSTLVERGGTAITHLVRENLAARLRDIGYDISIPFIQGDFWAQAAFRPLEDGIPEGTQATLLASDDATPETALPRVEGFKRLFREGVQGANNVLFDHTLTDEKVEEEFRGFIVTQGRAALIKCADKLTQSAATSEASLMNNYKELLMHYYLCGSPQDLEAATLDTIRYAETRVNSHLAMAESILDGSVFRDTTDINEIATRYQHALEQMNREISYGATEVIINALNDARIAAEASSLVNMLAGNQPDIEAARQAAAQIREHIQGTESHRGEARALPILSPTQASPELDEIDSIMRDLKGMNISADLTADASAHAVHLRDVFDAARQSQRPSQGR